MPKHLPVDRLQKVKYALKTLIDKGQVYDESFCRGTVHGWKSALRIIENFEAKVNDAKNN